MKEKKLVIQIVQHLSPGGLENMVFSLMDKSKNNQKTILVSLESNYAESVKKWSKIEDYKDNIIFLNKGAGFSIKVLLQLSLLFLKKRPNTVHTHHIGPLFYAGIAAYITGIKNRIHTEHDAWHLNNKKSLILQTKIINVLKPKIVAVSEIVAKSLTNKIPNANPIVISNGIDIEKFKPYSKIMSRSYFLLPKDKIIIGSAGRLVDVKGHKYLIQSLVKLDQNICLTIAGDGELKEELIQLTKELDLTGRVFFLGHVDNMKFFYNAVDVFCLPSLAEGLPLALLEAQACDVPCIASDVGGCKEVISTLSGTLTKSASTDNLRQSITEVIAKLPQYKPRQFVKSYGDACKMNLAYQNITN